MSENKSLKSSTRKGLLWSTIGNFANQGMRFVFGIILARMLSPNDYGIIGMLTVFISIVSVFIDCGFSQALIAKQDRDQKDFSTEFYFNIVVGIFGYIVLASLAPIISSFYDMPELIPILRVLGLGLIINSLCVVQSAQFSIRLDFKSPAIISVISQLSSGLFGIVLAYNGYGVWSLVFQQISGNVLNAILLWCIARWRPTAVFSKTSFKYLWGYGSSVLGASIISQLYDNIQPLIIGKAFNASTLGLYSRALQFAQLPSSNLSSIIGNVTFPILTKINNDLEHLGDVYRRMLSVTAFVVFPLMVGLASVSSPLIKVLLNEQWYGCIILLQITSIALMFQPISYINLNLLKAANRPDVVLKAEIIKKTVGLSILFLTAFWGILPFAIGNLVSCVFAVFVNTFYTSKTIKVSFMDQVKDLAKPFLCSVFMGTIIWITILNVESNIGALIIGIIVGIIVYLSLTYLFMKRSLQDACNLILKR